MTGAYSVTLIFNDDEEDVKLRAFRVGPSKLPPNQVIYKCLPLKIVLSTLTGIWVKESVKVFRLFHIKL